MQPEAKVLWYDEFWIFFILHVKMRDIINEMKSKVDFLKNLNFSLNPFLHSENMPTVQERPKGDVVSNKYCFTI